MFSDSVRSILPYHSWVSKKEKKLRKWIANAIQRLP